MAADRVPQAAGRQLPVGLGLFALFGDREGAPQRVVHGRTAGQERLVDGCPVRLALPADLPARLLEPQHELHGRVHGGPYPVEEGVVAGGEVVVPGAHGDIGDEVGLAAVVGDVTGVPVGVGRVPGAVLVLMAGEPGVGAFGGVVLAGRVEGHGGLGVVPRVEVVATEPGYGAVLALHGEEPADGRCGLLGGQYAGQDELFGLLRARHASALGRCGLVA